MHYAKVSKEIEHEKLGKFKVDFTVPQVDSVPELSQFYGGDTELVSRNNKVIARSAAQSSVLRLQKSSATNPNELQEQIKAEVEATKNYKPEAGGGLSKTKKADAVDALQALATGDREKFLKMTPDEIIAMLTGQQAAA